jgi:diamine N-acetyltransferase
MRLEKLTPDNVRRACDLKVAPEQQKFVAPVAVSIAEAYVHGEMAWPRVIMDGDRMVGFVMVAIQPEEENPVFRFCLWRLNIDASEQGKGYGRFAVQAVADEARRRGVNRLTVTWHPGEGGPEEFYRKIGFEPTGEVFDSEKAGSLDL